MVKAIAFIWAIETSAAGVFYQVPVIVANFLISYYVYAMIVGGAAIFEP